MWELTLLITILIVGAIGGSVLTLIVGQGRSLLNANRERQRRIEIAEATSQRVSEVLEQVMTRFESLEERLEFSEKLIMERGSEREPRE